jgi:hypothetical protein
MTTTTQKRPAAPPPSLFNAALNLHLFRHAALQKLTQPKPNDIPQ